MHRKTRPYFIRMFAVLIVLSLAFPSLALGQGATATEAPPEPTLSYHSRTGKVRFMAAAGGEALAQAAASDRAILAAADQSAADGDRVSGAAFADPSVTAAYERSARAFLDQYAAQFGIRDPQSELALMRARPLENGAAAVRFQQMHQGVPVMAGELIVRVDRLGQTLAASGEALPDPDLSVQPGITAATAAQTAGGLIAKMYGLEAAQATATEPALWIYSPALLGAPGPQEARLAWRTEVTAAGRPDIRELALVDAQAGAVLVHFNQVHAVLDRKVYTKNNANDESLPGTLVRSEGEAASGNTDADNAYDYGGATYNYYRSMYGRDSIDDKGMSLIQTVDYCDPDYTCPYANAFWNGSQMVYGDNYASADDVVAHELTHGVTEHESGLFYFMQSGAINEAFSDIWGEAVDLAYSNGQDNDLSGVRWLMGEDLPIGAIRSMSNPPAFNDPDRVRSVNYYCPDEVFTDAGDSGGVHYNSGVVNKAAYLMADGGTFNGYTVTGIGVDKMARVFYGAQISGLTTGSDFQDLHDALAYSCSAQIGQNGITAANCDSVRKAIKAVELDLQPSSSCAKAEVADAPVCDAPVFALNTGSPLSGWTQLTSGWSTGAGYIQGSGANNSYISIGRGSVFSDFTFSADIYSSGVCATCPIGLLVRGDATLLPAQSNRWNEAYFMAINPGGQYKVEHWTPTGIVTLQPWTNATTDIYTGNATNYLTVKSESSKLSFYANGALVWSGLDYTLRSAQVGIAMAGDASAGDFIQVYEAGLAGGTPINLFIDSFEDGMARWTVADHNGTGDAWIIDPWSNAALGIKSLYAYDRSYASDVSAAMTNAVTLPASGSVFMRFKHYYHVETSYDGGVVEYSANGGAWTDAGPLFVNRGYDMALSSAYGNPIGGRSAFTGITYGFTSSRLNLGSLLGKSVRFRFRLGNDTSNISEVDGWNVDDVQIYACGLANYSQFRRLPLLIR